MEMTRELAEAIAERGGELTLSSVPLLCQLEKTGFGTLACPQQRLLAALFDFP